MDYYFVTQPAAYPSNFEKAIGDRPYYALDCGRSPPVRRRRGIVLAFELR